MIRKRGLGFPFLISYLGAFLPVLIVSIMVSTYFNSNWRTTERVTYQVRTDQITAQVVQLYTRHYKNSIRFYERKSELRPDRMLSPLTNAYGIEVLADIQLLDENLSCVFGYYSADSLLHTSGGSVSRDTFFATTSDCTSTSVKDGLRLLGSEKSGAVLLNRTKNVNGHLYMHFPVSNEDGCVASINYMVPYQNLADIALTPYATELCAAKLSIGGADAWFVNRGGRMVPAGASEYPTDLTPYLECGGESEEMDLQVEVLFSSEAMNRRLRSEQRVFYLLLAGGTLASVLLSFLFASRRLKDLHDLEAAVRGEEVPQRRKRRRSEFEYIKSLLTDSRAAQHAEVARYSSQLTQRNAQLRRQTAMMVFQGLFADRKAVNELLQPCGILLREDYLYVGGLMFGGAPEIMDQFSTYLCADLFDRKTIEGREVLFFLAELPDPDDDCACRMDMAVQLNHILTELGAQQVRVVLSRTYGTVSMAGVAYQEAAALAERICRDPGAFAAPYVCWDQAAAASGTVQLPDSQAMDVYVAAIRAHRYADAAKQLHKQLRALAVSACSPENRRYLRYCLVQPLVEAVRDAALQNGDDLIAEALHIDPSQEGTFERALCGVLNQYCRSVVAQSDFSRILDYIRAHFTDPELSAEQVADCTGVDKSHLGRIFRAKVGVSYMDYVTNLRMERARQLLAEGELTIREIVQQIGYIDDSSFRRKFRAIHGVPVSEYRDRIRREKNGSAPPTP